MSATPDRYQPVDEDAIDQSMTILRAAKFGSLAALQPETGDPLVSRVAFFAFRGKQPMLFVSALAAHTPALLTDPRCSLLLGDVKRGDPLANARLTLKGRVERIPPNHQDHQNIREEFQAHQPKSKLYIDLPDFTFFQLNVSEATFVAGFGRAYKLDAGLFQI